MLRTAAATAINLALAAGASLGVSAAQILADPDDPQLLEFNRDEAAPAPAATAAPTSVEEMPSSLSPDRAAPSGPVYTVHLASYYDVDDAMMGWEILSSRYPNLTSFEPILRDVDLGAKGQFIRLLAGPIDGLPDAEQLCEGLRGAGTYCVPADAAGAVLYSSRSAGG